jgi:hypothetical protein
MGLLDDMLKADSAVFVDTDGFGEQVTYSPLNGTPRTINAIVNRQPPEVYSGSGEVLTPLMSILVRNDATYGISSATLNANGNDRVTVAERIGGTAKSYGVYLPENGGTHDVGMLELYLR